MFLVIPIICYPSLDTGNYIYIFHGNQIYIFFNLDNLEPALGRAAPELEIKALKIVKLDVLEQARGCPN